MDLDNPGPGSSRIINFWWYYQYQGQPVATKSTDKTRQIIRNYIQNITNGIILEISIYGGATLLDIHDICQKNNNQIIGIDPWEKITNFHGQTQIDNIKQKQIQNILLANRIKLENIISKYNLKIKLYQNNSQDIYSEFQDNSIDLIYLDGNHCKNFVYLDLKLYYPKLKPAGIIIGDNISWISVLHGLDKFASELNIPYTKSADQFYITKKN